MSFRKRFSAIISVFQITAVLPGKTSAGGDDAYIRRYDVDGNVIVTRPLG